MQAIFERKPSDFCLQDFEVSKTIRLPVEVFEDVLKNPIRDYDFRQHLDAWVFIFVFNSHDIP